MKKNSSPIPLQTLTILIPCVLFAGAYYQWPLFSSNQNSYFLKGLADSGYGHLSSDWLAQQTDHIPVFSALVALIHGFGSHWIFYAVLGAITTIYAVSLFAIVHPSVVKPSIPQSTAFFALLTLIHSPWLLIDFSDLTSWLWHNLPQFKWLASLSTKGLAGQSILGPFLQPSVFGVFLITSISLFVHKREFLAIVCVVLAASIHPTYILHAAVLTSAYIVVLAFERSTVKAIRVGALALLLILPILLYVVLSFPTGSPSVHSMAQEILVEARIPHHAKVSHWFSINSCVQLAIILLGIALSRRSNRLFQVLSFCTVTGIGLTLLQIISGSDALSLFFPWRLSTWLIPSCTAIILGKLSLVVTILINAIPKQQIQAAVKTGLVCMLFMFLGGACFLGVSRTLAGIDVDKHRGSVESYAKMHSSPDQIYLIPLNLESFRIASGVPIFVDWKSHPYRDTELLEWYKRVKLAMTFYKRLSTRDASAALTAIQRHARITHVVVPGKVDHLHGIRGDRVFQNSQHVVYELE